MDFDYCEHFFLEWLIFTGYNHIHKLTQPANTTSQTYNSSQANTVSGYSSSIACNYGTVEISRRSDN